ncbi:MAG: KH domain-containing protein [Patescibacteria group bacterium]|nr:KH domain-containing protein [Patescibacteria group bacterium]
MEKPVYQEVLEKIIVSLVNNPNEVKVQRTIDEMGVLLRVKLHPQDMGLVVGRKGENIRSIKNIIKAIGSKHHARVNIKIEEPTPLDRAVASKKNLKSEEIIRELKEEQKE